MKKDEKRKKPKKDNLFIGQLLRDKKWSYG
jgi:hypothetical protein